MVRFVLLAIPLCAWCVLAWRAILLLGAADFAAASLLLGAEMLCRYGWLLAPFRRRRRSAAAILRLSHDAAAAAAAAESINPGSSSTSRPVATTGSKRFKQEDRGNEESRIIGTFLLPPSRSSKKTVTMTGKEDLILFVRIVLIPFSFLRCV